MIIFENKEITVQIQDKIYKPRYNNDTLEVFTVPQDEVVLRTPSIPLSEEEMQHLSLFAKTTLLATMRQSNGVGIAAVQVGLPLKLFIVDKINVTKLSENGDYVTSSFGDIATTKGCYITQGNKFYYDNEGTLCAHTVYSEVIVDNDNKNVKPLEVHNSPDFIINHFPQFFFNATIQELSENKIIAQEGCLSVPNIIEKISRTSQFKINYYNIEGKECNEEIDRNTLSPVEDLRAYCILHEYEHTLGKIFTDNLQDEVESLGTLQQEIV